MAEAPILVSKGAEAEIYLAHLHGLKVVIKKRVDKPYRTQEFNRFFIVNRTRIEAKILSELHLAGLNVPALLFVDEEAGVLGMEYVEGERLSNIIDTLDHNAIVSVAREIGSFAGRMHKLCIYHGDYTLANVIASKRGLVVIDFGLAGYSTDIEEFAIDLHLMLRSVHAMRPDAASVFEKNMVEAYVQSYGVHGESIIRRMREIRARGRYVDRELRKSIMKERYVG
ncbi:MAG: Kae1-associated kinase Bud32 [Desulfurococcaceae archaeon]